MAKQWWCARSADFSSKGQTMKALVAMMAMVIVALLDVLVTAVVIMAGAHLMDGQIIPQLSFLESLGAAGLVMAIGNGLDRA